MVVTIISETSILGMTVLDTYPSMRHEHNTKLMFELNLNEFRS